MAIIQPIKSLCENKCPNSEPVANMNIVRHNYVLGNNKNMILTDPFNKNVKIPNVTNYNLIGKRYAVSFSLSVLVPVHVNSLL